MGKVIDRLQADQFEQDIIAFIKDVQLTYSKEDRAYQTNSEVNYAIYTFAELVEALEIVDPDHIKLFKKLLQEHCYKANDKFDTTLTTYNLIEVQDES